MDDREKVIKGLESLRNICNAKSDMAIGEGKVAWAGYANTADDALALLKAQEPGWISVENKTPEMFYRFDLCLDLHYYVSEIVLVTDGENYGVARYTKDEIDDDPIWDIASIYEMTPTHWMPLPEPPKEEPC